MCLPPPKGRYLNSRGNGCRIKSIEIKFEIRGKDRRRDVKRGKHRVALHFLRTRRFPFIRDGGLRSGKWNSMEERIGRGSLRRSILEREDLEKHVSPDCSLTRNSLLLYLLEALEGAITRAKEGIRDDKEEGSGWLRGLKIAPFYFLSSGVT